MSQISDAIAIIGSGMAGLACARRLVDAGRDVVVMDKGRGIGGRMATRRGPDGATFDHGAQYLTARDSGFSSILGAARRAGAVEVWEDGSSRERFVGTPGMSALGKYLAADLDIRQGVEVASVCRTDAAWEVTVPAGTLLFGQVVITVPAPQLIGLVGAQHPMAQEITSVHLEPCLTLMAAFDAEAPHPYNSRADPEDPLNWIALNSSKPGRGGLPCWVAQAGPEFSAAHLELERGEIVEQMLPLLVDRIGASRNQLVHAEAHRWRYARVSSSLERPFLSDTSRTLRAGGDWCLGARVEAAWLSGDAIARDILEAV